MDVDYYVVLGVGEEVSAEEIKAAFRRAALQSHPDRHPGKADAEEGFKQLSAAYAVLGNPETRRRYDLYRELVLLCRRLGGPSAARRAQALERLFLEREPPRPLRKALGALRTARRAGNSLAAGLSLQEAMPLKRERMLSGAAIPRFAGRLLALSALPLRNSSAPRTDRCRKEADIRWTFWLSARDAVAGSPVAVSYLQDSAWRRIRFRLPPGVRDGVWIRFRGMGNRSGGRNGRGDLYVKIRVKPWG